MTALLLKAAPWLAGVILLLSIGGYAGWRANPWQARYHALQLSDAQQRADGEAAVRKELTEQLAQAQATSDNNAQSLVNLANENAQVTADRDANLALARRLLASSARPTTPDRGVSKATGEPATPATSGPASPTRAESLLVAAADESERCANQLNALIAQIKPQL